MTEKEEDKTEDAGSRIKSGMTEGDDVKFRLRR